MSIYVWNLIVDSLFYTVAHVNGVDFAVALVAVSVVLVVVGTYFEEYYEVEL